MGDYMIGDRDVFNLHMNQIKQKGSLITFDRDMKIREEQEFSKFVQE